MRKPKRQKLTQQQKQRIQFNKKKLLDQNEELDYSNNSVATVLCRMGNQVDLETEQGITLRCQLRRNLGSVVAGDKVLWQNFDSPQDGTQGVVLARQTRQSELKRHIAYQGLKTVAANIDRVFIMNAIEPKFSLAILDRYLVAAEQYQIEAIIIINKCDLCSAAELKTVKDIFAIYEKIGYPVLYMSATTQAQIEGISPYLQNHVSIFTGQSGVGKSTLLNSLLPEAQAHTQDISDNSKLGQHTTTATRLYRMDANSAIIDSPGIREFTLEDIEADALANCFREFQDFLGGCKFRNCLHQQEPGCAILQQVAEGKISTQRLSSYQNILADVLAIQKN